MLHFLFVCLRMWGRKVVKNCSTTFLRCVTRFIFIFAGSEKLEADKAKASVKSFTLTSTKPNCAWRTCQSFPWISFWAVKLVFLPFQSWKHSRVYLFRSSLVRHVFTPLSSRPKSLGKSHFKHFTRFFHGPEFTPLSVQTIWFVRTNVRKISSISNSPFPVRLFLFRFISSRKIAIGRSIIFYWFSKQLKIDLAEQQVETSPTSPRLPRLVLWIAN